MPDANDARRLVNDRVRAIVLVTPNNPTGAVYPPKTIAAFRDLCAEHDIALILDETYRDFMSADASPHACLAEPTWQRTVIQLYSFSKAYCIPGHRAGAIVADAGTLGEIAKIMDTLQICAPRSRSSCCHGRSTLLREWREGNRQEIVRRADAFTRAISALDGWSIGSIGAYFAYVAHPFREPKRRRNLRVAGSGARRPLPSRRLFRSVPGWISCESHSQMSMFPG